MKGSAGLPVRWWLLGKRLLKKYTFLLLLCLIPLLAALIAVLPQEESGMLHIILCRTNPDDEVSTQITASLLEDSRTVLRFEENPDEEEARELVRSGSADAAWIFPQDMEEALAAYVRGEDEDGVVTIVEREDNVALRAAAEKLFAALYPYFSYEIYADFFDSELEVTVSKEELYNYYEDAKIEGNLFQLSYVEGTAVTEQEDYLTAPLRGMLSLLIVLCGLAATLYYMQDQENGIMAPVCYRRRRWWLYGYQSFAMLTAGAAVLAALAVSGSMVDMGRELALMLLYIAVCMPFCSIIRTVCGKASRFGAAILLCLLVMIIVCPIFFSLGQLRLLSWMVPPFYYLNAVSNTWYIKKMLLYGAILYLTDYAGDRLHTRLCA